MPAEIYREIYGTDLFEDDNAIYINAVGWIAYDTLDCDKLTIFESSKQMHSWGSFSVGEKP